MILTASLAGTTILALKQGNILDMAFQNVDFLVLIISVMTGFHPPYHPDAVAFLGVFD